ncbi:oxidoreductase [Pantoea phage Kyle]|uniref:Oxidoreductase n=1 Tax=Pantoea phage Kyle TaxID=2589665 RepID=A0A514A8Q0_9CAUD|nr:oxidoreductase [Pantoea phage Kyle]QDH49653.1 oxidoreductase [Pantoea phage Kyle]
MNLTKSIVIAGAGLAGLITACHFKKAPVYEAGPRMPQHRALLRFRGEEVSKLTGIPFRAVRVDKAVVYGNQMHQGTCPLNLANMYSLKVTGQLSGRSIMKLETATRYIAPDDFYDRLIEEVGEDRILFETPIDEAFNFNLDNRPSIISTIPMQVMMKITNLEHDEQIPFAFARQSISVHRFKVNVPCDIYQTIYFPAEDLKTYRASITGDTMIVEMIENGGSYMDTDIELAYIAGKFGLHPTQVDIASAEVVDQRYGKIVDMPQDLRQAVLYELTSQFRVFSIGRFATWRNLLLDDVADDVLKVDNLIHATNYQRLKNFK